MISLLQQAPLAFVLLAVILLLSLAFHELAHAWVAERVGDPTARNLGRITFNPLAHLDPIGTLLILFVGFGWAKPVPIQPKNFHNYRQGLLLVSIAGVTVNFLMALLALLILKLLGFYFDPSSQLGFPLTPTAGSVSEQLTQNATGFSLFVVLVLTAQINIVLTIFNLLPIPPLDGSKVVQALAPDSWQQAIWQLERYSFLIIIAMFTLLRDPIFNFINRILVALMQVIL